MFPYFNYQTPGVYSTRTFNKFIKKAIQTGGARSYRTYPNFVVFGWTALTLLADGRTDPKWTCKQAQMALEKLRIHRVLYIAITFQMITSTGSCDGFTRI